MLRKVVKGNGRKHQKVKGEGRRCEGELGDVKKRRRRLQAKRVSDLLENCEEVQQLVG